MPIDKIYRIATLEDIPAMHRIRMSVKENVLNNPLLVTEKDYVPFLSKNGKGWVCEIAGEIVGFAIIDIERKNVWALFVSPDHEKMGIGNTLQNKMLTWYFSNYEHTIWLTTAPGTRAEKFYRKSGWVEKGLKNKEFYFEMSIEDFRRSVQ